MIEKGWSETNRKPDKWELDGSWGEGKVGGKEVVRGLAKEMRYTVLTSKILLRHLFE